MTQLFFYSNIMFSDGLLETLGAKTIKRNDSKLFKGRMTTVVLISVFRIISRHLFSEDYMNFLILSAKLDNYMTERTSSLG